MTLTQRRGKAGWWVFALVGGILLAAGIRYLSSTEWWANFFNRDRPTYQTVNTGASVQVATSTSTPIDRSSPRPLPPNPNPDPQNQDLQRRRMW